MKSYAPAVCGVLMLLEALLHPESAGARDTLNPSGVCPPETEQPDAYYGYRSGTCEVGGLAWDGKGAAKSIRKRLIGDFVIKVFLISGRLNNGKPSPYALTFRQSLTDYFALTDRSGPVAYDVLSSNEGRMVIWTDRGWLHILTKGIGLEPPPNVVVIDEQRSEVLARYYDECIDLSFLNRRQPIIIWDEGRRRCVSLTPGKHRVVRSNTCERPKTTDCGGRPSVPSHFVPAAGFTIHELDRTIRDMRRLRLSPNNQSGYFGGTGWGVRAYRIPGTSYLILRGSCGDCF